MRRVNGNTHRLPGVSVDSNYPRRLGSGTGTEIRCDNYRMNSRSGAEGVFAFGTYPSTIYLRGKKNDKVKYVDREQRVVEKNAGLSVGRNVFSLFL